MGHIYTIKLTMAEINHINALLRQNELDGSYTAPKEQYWKRHERIKAKITAASEGEEMEDA